MTDILYITSISLAVLSMMFGKSTYSTFLSLFSILSLMLTALEKTSYESTIILLITFAVFETVCFTQKAWSLHRFNPAKVSRHKLFWITLCMTIGVSAAWTTSVNLNSFTLAKLSLENSLVKLILPIAFCIYGLKRNKKSDRV